MLEKGVLLFGLNLIDALLTLFWVRNDVAEEGNALMAHLLEVGDTPFLLVKILMGTLAMVVFYRYGNLKVAQYGVKFSLLIYLALMGVHLLTGVSALWM